MLKKINPFHELYVTETIGSDNYIKIFSPYFCKHEHALPLFQPGNIVLMGTKGSGKSMLLRLFHPETRIAYMNKNEDFPIPEKLSCFISAGINLTQSGIHNFGQREIVEAGHKERDVTALYFGDYLNYWILLDLMRSVELIMNNPVLSSKIGANADFLLLDKYASAVAREACWLGYLNNVETWIGLRNKLSGRIIDYKKFLNFNIDNIPQQIQSTKTTIGEPLSRASALIKEHGILNRDCHVFIKIDQLEVLTGLDVIKSNYGVLYRQIINKALGMRDPNISYRIGSRRYSWKDTLQIYGMSSFIEEDRDYKILDIDEILRRKESPRVWSFPKYAEDIFRKRLLNVGFNLGQQEKEDLLREVFGSADSNQKIAETYAGSSRKRILNLEDEWPTEWKTFLMNLAESNPLSARYGEAWCRQSQISKKAVMDNIPLIDKLPWETKSKAYWRKERAGQALMQMAARCGQRMIFAGKNNIIALSGGNILAFLKICQQIWAVWVRDSKRKEDAALGLPKIEAAIQSMGIHEASSNWYQQVIARETDGNKRQRFIERLGTYLYKRLYEDKAMSYPGGNGFSLKESDLEKQPGVNRFLQDTSDFGDLYEFPHTTKTKDKAKRKKWYLHPLLSPYFKIHVEHTKEPLYLSIEEIVKLMKEAGIQLDEYAQKLNLNKTSPNDSQLNLLGMDD